MTQKCGCSLSNIYPEGHRVPCDGRREISSDYQFSTDTSVYIFYLELTVKIHIHVRTYSNTHTQTYIHLINSIEKTDSKAHIDMYAGNITIERGKYCKKCFQCTCMWMCVAH